MTTLERRENHGPRLARRARFPEKERTRRVLEAELGLKHIASGDLFRENLRDRTPLGLRANDYMTTGALVPDDITIAMLRDRLQRPDAEAGVLLDGFPRTMEQAIALTEMLETLDRQIDGVVYVDCRHAALVERLSGQ